MAKSLHILMVEDSASDAGLVARHIEHAGYEMRWERVDDAATLKVALDQQPWDVILCDYSMVDFSGADALAIVRASGLDIPFIFVSGAMGEDVAVEAMKAGAHDYVMKGNLKRLVPAIERELREAAERRKRRQAELAQRQNEQRFRALIEHSQDAIALFGANGVVLYASPSTTNVLGYLPEELRERNALDFVRPDWQDAVRERLAESLRQPGVAIPAEAYVRHKDGEYHFLEGIFTNLLHEPAVGAIVNNYRDITGRKQAETKLVEWKNRYEATLKASSLLLYDRDPVTNAITWGGDLERILGYTPEEIAGGLANWLELIHPDDRAIFNQELESIIAEQKPFHLVYRVRRKDGSYIVTQDDGYFVLGAQSHITRVVGFVTDITERKRAEDALKQRAAELERFHRLSVGRELQMIELKKEVNELARLAGRTPPYDLSRLEIIP